MTDHEILTGYGDQSLSSVDMARYAAIASVMRTDPLMEAYVPAETGLAFRVGKGQVLRIACVDGPQVCDFNAFAADDPSEYFWSGRTRTLQGAHLSVGDRLWSVEPKMRPMFTIVADTVPRPPLPHNAASHDLIYARCSASAWALRTGRKDAPNCNDNLIRALERIGFDPSFVHDAFNIFMTTGIDDRQKLFFLPPVARRGDYVELYAEIDTVVAVSACPGGCNGEENKGLQISVFDLP
jgi:uncharacterized protein YcgI (DUF1989 family)